MFFTQAKSQARPGAARHLALAIALATGSVVAMSGVIADPAHAQKKKKKGKKDYSETFVAAYNPINEALNTEGADPKSVMPQVANLFAASVSADERFLAGNTAYAIGLKAEDRQMQFDGMKLMLGSGQVGLEQLGQYNFIAFQLARALEVHDQSRTYLAQAINYNFTTESINPTIMRIEMSETFFREDRFKEGLAELKGAIDANEASGKKVDEAWYRRGLTVAFNNNIQPEVYGFVTDWVAAYPSEKNWRDAVNITRQLNDYGAAETLDILRLGQRLGTLQDQIEYLDYVEAADPRRLPQEVKSVIEAGYAAGVVSRDDIYLSESLQTAKSRIASDRADLPALERDARASGAGLRTVMAAGDAFLSYNQMAKAEEFYTKALGMPGVDRSLASTRLGIAQVEQGKLTDAKGSFAQVQGSRGPIALLWMSYIEMKSAAAAPAVAALPGA